MCPRMCGVDRAWQRGICGAGETPEVALWQLHHYEEPFISGAPDDIRGSGTVFFKHCGLKCVYCQNYKISNICADENVRTDAGLDGAGGVKDEADGYDNVKSAGGNSLNPLPGIFLKLQGQGAYNINLVTPTHYTGGITCAVAAARARGLDIPVIWNTSGYERPETIAKLFDTADIYLTDFKYYGETPAKRYSNAPDYFKYASAALKEMVSQRPKLVFDKRGMLRSGVVVRHMSLPGHLSDSCKVLEYIYGEYGDNICISIMSQYTPQKGCDFTKYPELHTKVSKAQYRRLVSYAMDLGISNAYIQGGAAVSESFTPDF